MTPERTETLSELVLSIVKKKRMIRRLTFVLLMIGVGMGGGGILDDFDTEFGYSSFYKELKEYLFF